ncbi:cupin domain-containing protein [soil metagenome]
MTDIPDGLALALSRAADIDGPLPATGRRAGADVGDAQTGLLEIFRSERVKFGVWECTPGGWEIENRKDTETMILLAGRVRLTTRGEEPVELGTGDAFVLPRGWSGRWDVLETVRKVYTLST